jgi:hypothetical protein
VRRVGLAAVLLSAALVALVAPVSAQAGGSISGTLVDAATQEPIASEYVSAMSPTGQGGAVSGSDGSYLIDGLPAGDYRLAAGNWAEASYSEYVLVYWPDALTYPDATIVTVAAGEDVTGVDFELELGGVVTGTVTDAWTGAVVGPSSVSVQKREAGGDWPAGGIGYRVEADGTYRIGGLSGEYRLEFHENQYLSVRLDPFVIGPGETLTLDIAATPSQGTPFATIAGRVCETDDPAVGCLSESIDESQRQLLAGTTVEARDGAGAVLGTTTTDASGWFSLEELTPGTIVVSALAPPGMSLVQAREFSLGPNEGVWDAELLVVRLDVRYLLTSHADPEEVPIDEDAQFDLELSFAPADSSAAPFDVTDVVVAVRLQEGLDYEAHSGDGRFDPSTGIWTVPVLASGSPAQMSITVRSGRERDFRPNAEIVSADWPDSSVTFGDGRGSDHTSSLLTVTPAPAEPVTDEGIIAGTVWLDDDEDGVIDTTESPLTGVEVLATRDDGSTLTDVTDDSGRFEMGQLRAGTYQMELDRSSLPDDVEPPAGRLLVAISSGAEIRQVDFGCTGVAGGFPWWIVMIAGAVLLTGAALIAWWVVGRLERPPTRTGPPRGDATERQVDPDSTTRTLPVTGSTSTML